MVHFGMEMSATSAGATDADEGDFTSEMARFCKTSGSGSANTYAVGELSLHVWHQKCKGKRKTRWSLSESGLKGGYRG